MVLCSFSQCYLHKKEGLTHACSESCWLTADLYRVMPVFPDIVGLPALAGLSGGRKLGCLRTQMRILKEQVTKRLCDESLGTTQDTLANSEQSSAIS